MRGAFGDAPGAGAGSPQCRFGSVGPVDARVVDATGAECFAPARAEARRSLPPRRAATRLSFYEAHGSRTVVLEYVDEAEAASRDAREARGPGGSASSARRCAPPRRGGASRRRHAGVRSEENLGPFVAFGDVVVPVASFVSSRLVLVETPPQPLEHPVLETSATRSPFAASDASAFRGETRGALRGFDRERDEPSVAESAPFAYHDAPRAVTFAPRLAAEDGGTGLVVTLAFSASAGDPGVATPASACRVGTIGPLVGAPRLAEAGARFAATTCVSPASKPGARRVVAGSGIGFAESSRDVSSWTASAEVLSVVSAAEIRAVVPSAAVRASAERLDVVGAWLDAACGENRRTARERPDARDGATVCSPRRASRARRRRS